MTWDFYIYIIRVAYLEKVQINKAEWSNTNKNKKRYYKHQIITAELTKKRTLEQRLAHFENEFHLVADRK